VISLTLSILYTHSAKTGREDVLRELARQAGAAAALSTATTTNLSAPVIQPITTNLTMPVLPTPATNAPATNAPATDALATNASALPALTNPPVVPVTPGR
jgi:hypothetical protein